MTASAKPEKIRCDACPVMCYIADGKSGACDRYANHGGELVRLDPLTIIQSGQELVPFMGDGASEDWDGDIIKGERQFVTAVGAGTTYPDYKPAPFIASQQVDGVDMVTVVTEGIFSYCGVKVKIDTDRHIGDERAVVRADGEAVGHVMTSEYGSKMLSLGGVEHLTGGSKAEGRVTCDALLRLCNREPVELTIDGGARLTVEAGQPPIIDGVPERLMRVGCGSAAIGMFARAWEGKVDEVVVVDDHITGVLTEHEAGKGLGLTPSGIRVNGRRSTPGRYFQVAAPGTGWWLALKIVLGLWVGLVALALIFGRREGTLFGTMMALCAALVGAIWVSNPGPWMWLWALLLVPAFYGAQRARLIEPSRDACQTQPKASG